MSQKTSKAEIRKLGFVKGVAFHQCLSDRGSRCRTVVALYKHDDIAFRINYHNNSQEHISFIAVERPYIAYVNPKFVANISITATRYSRQDPMYYVNIYAETIRNWDNNITVNFYVFSLPASGPVLMELHYKWCDLIRKDEIIGGLLRSYLPASCPTPKGIYKISNLTTASLPPFFVEHLPFSKGRLFSNFTVNNEKLAEGFVDIEVKRMKT